MENNKFHYALAFIIAFIVILGLVLLKPSIKPSLNEERILNILSDIYSPKSLEYMAERKEYYVKSGIISQEESDKLFVSTGSLTKEDLDRKVSIRKISRSLPKENSLSNSLYKVNYDVRYSGEVTSFQIVLFVNKDGCVYKHELVSGT